MVKRVNLVFDEEQHARLLAKKGSLTWEEFVMKLANGENGD